MPPRPRAKPRSADHAALGRAVKELRREAGLTQEGLADRMHSEFAPVGKLERGLENPTFSSLLRLTQGLGIELSQLVQRFEEIQRSMRQRT